MEAKKKRQYDDDFYHTIDEAAEYFGLSRQAICQIQNRAFAKIRKALKKDGIATLGDFYDRSWHNG